MARIARVVVPGLPHHITQRGNRRQDVFFQESDYKEYLSLMRKHCDANGVEIWGYCLMSNHIHLIAVPEEPDSLARGIGEAHRRYTRMINFREKWRGYLWQGRFASSPMNEHYLHTAMRYIELNPVRAKMVEKPWQYKWSSANAHIKDRKDDLITPTISLQTKNWKKYLLEGMNEEEVEHIQYSERTGRPLGDEAFLEFVEGITGRELKKKKPGPKPKQSKKKKPRKGKTK
jgi:putative transposase